MRRKRPDGDYVHVQETTTFLWRRSKADEVKRKRQIGIQEAASVFFDPNVLPEPDAVDPDRGVYIGMSSRTRMLVVVFVEIVDDVRMRIITAWPASSDEELRYDEKQRPKGASDTRSARDPRRSRFLDFFRRHHPAYRPSMYRLPRAGFRSRLTGTMARFQEKAWAVARGLKLPTGGRRLAAVRKILGMSQTVLATRSRIPQPSISRMERGEEKIGIRRAERLAGALGVQPSEILWGRR